MTDMHVQDSLPAFALGALDEDERRAVAAHLSTCPLCAAELRAFQLTVDQLALAAPQRQPPARLRQAIISRARSERQSAPPPARPLRRAGWFTWLSGLFAARPALALTSLLLILFLAAGNLFLLQQVRALRQERNTFRLVRLTPDPVASGASGLVIVSPDGAFGALIVDRLPELSKDQQYQLWLNRDGQRVSGGVFSVYSSGYGVLRVVAPDPLSTYTSFGITIEPAGGSPGPTGQRVMGSG